MNVGSVLSPQGLELAYRDRPGKAPAVVFLPGFNSAMTGGKARYLDELCARAGHRCVRFDYRGHGDSGGQLEDGSVQQWYADASFIYDHLALDEVVLVGSSMGTWIALLLARRIGVKVRGLIGIAGAVDFTAHARDRLSPDQAAELAEVGITYRPSRYGDGPYPLTERMLEEGNAQRILGTGLELACPVHLFHGMNDPDLPWEHVLEIANGITASSLEITVVSDGDHRLSRPRDLETVGLVVGRMLRPVLV